MTRARTVLPTDLVALVSFDGRVYPNEAKTWDHLSAHDRGPHPLETAIEQWLSFATGKHTWISVRGATIRGLVSVRQRAKRSAWEVDCLINAGDDPGVCLSLLERMDQGVGRAGAERVFLRLNSDSPLFDLVRQAGFFPYTRERLFRRDHPIDIEAPDLPLRPKTKVDQWGIFQLYNTVAPANVRSIEGLSFREWQAGQERWGGRIKELVLEEDGIITAWLRLGDGQDGRFRLLVLPDRSRDVSTLLHAVLARLVGKQPLLTLLPAYADVQAPALERLAFRPAGDYVLLARRRLQTVEEMEPEKVGQAIPVS